MKIQRYYTDTSVIGGYFDEEFSADSRPYLDHSALKSYRVVVSDLVLAELIGAPQIVRRLIESMHQRLEIVSADEESQALQEAYLSRKVVPRGCENDAHHVAIATVNDCDLIVSWNFKHLVRVDRIRKFCVVNLELGYKPIDIRSPKEVNWND
jgi:predicted nucleic acid-binding protein